MMQQSPWLSQGFWFIVRDTFGKMCATVGLIFLLSIKPGVFCESQNKIVNDVFLSPLKMPLLSYQPTDFCHIVAGFVKLILKS